jgi:2'-5' RNA ligase
MRTYYLAIEPPAHELGRLSALMRRLGDPTPLPHITVVTPPELGPEPTWLGVVEEVATQSEPVTITIGEPRTFDDRVLYLSVDSSAIGALRRQLLEAIEREATGPVARENEAYVPHLTLAIARRGRRLPTPEQVDPLAVRVDAFVARELTLFRRDEPAPSYRAWRRFALGGG